MDSPNALPLPPSAISLHGMDTHIATGIGALQVQAQGAIAPIRMREGPVRSAPVQFAAPLRAETHAASRQQVITLQLQNDDTRDRLDEHLCNVWDTRKLFFMHPHDMSAHGLAEGDSVLVSAVMHGLQMRHMVRLRVVPYDVPRSTARGYFRECAPLVTAESSSAQDAPGIRVHVMSAAH